MAVEHLKFESTIYLKTIPLDKKFVSMLENTNLKKYEQNSNNFFDKDFHDQAKTQTIYNYIEPHINEILNRKFKLDTWWVQKYGKQDYHDLHTHGSEQNWYSFILYLKVTDDSSKTIFYGPAHPLINWKGKEVKPKPGLIVLFPSYIPHSVGYNKDTERLILSGNIKCF
tara:strand:+ start:60 stop:566 length:507 start_codon:yes stop_codon:yes gene_type:complete